MQKILHVLAWLTKALGILGAVNVIPFIAPEKGIMIFAGASLFKDFLIGLGDILDDGQKNNSFQPNLPNLKCLLPFLLAAGLALGGTGCASSAPRLARELAKDPNAAGFSIQLVTPWGQQLVSFARGTSTNPATAGGGAATVGGGK